MDSGEQVRVVILGTRKGYGDFNIITTLGEIPPNTAYLSSLDGLIVPLKEEDKGQLLLKGKVPWETCLEDCCTKRVFVEYYSAFGVVQKNDWNDCMVKKVCPSLSVWFDDDSPGLPDGYRQAIPRMYVRDDVICHGVGDNMRAL